jgi:hypothetical protein
MEVAAAAIISTTAGQLIRGRGSVVREIRVSDVRGSRAKKEGVREVKARDGRSKKV